jgi:hypothetical protein
VGRRKRDTEIRELLSSDDNGEELQRQSMHADLVNGVTLYSENITSQWMSCSKEASKKKIEVITAMKNDIRQRTGGRWRWPRPRENQEKEIGRWRQHQK